MTNGAEITWIARTLSTEAWPYWRSRVGGPCPKLGESRRTGCVDKAVGDPVTIVLLPSSCPHDGFSRKGLGGWIPCVPMERLSHLCVLSDARVDARVAVRLGWIRWVVGDVGRRPALVRHTVCLEVVAFLIFM